MKQYCTKVLIVRASSFSSSLLDPSAAAAMVGSLVMGTRIGGAAGREIAEVEDDSDVARKVRTVPIKGVSWLAVEFYWFLRIHSGAHFFTE